MVPALPAASHPGTRLSRNLSRARAKATPVRQLPPASPFAVAIAFVLGLAVAPRLDRSEVPPSARWALAAAVGFVAVRRAGWILPAIACAGMAYGARATVDLTGADDRIVDRITGEVSGPVVVTQRGNGALLAGTATWVWATEPLTPGETIEVTGYLATPTGPRGPGLVDPADAARARGAEREISARSIRRLGDRPGMMDRWWRWAGQTQRGWVEDIDRAGGDANGRAALRGIAVGDRSAVPPELDQRWRAVGIYHVLSVSGLHLAVVAGLLYALLRRLIAAARGELHPARWAAPVAFSLAVIYTMITGAQLATLRALIVVGVMFAGAMLDRPARLVDALAVAATLILIWRPGDLFDPGFQLSFAAALMLALRQGSTRRPGVRGWLVHQLATSAWVTLVTAPITSFHFHEVTAGGVIGNLILTPLVELIALPLALVGLVLDIGPALAFSSWLVGLVDTVAAPLAEVSPVGSIALASPLLLAGLVVITLALAANKLPRAVGWIALCLAWSLGRVPPPEGSVRVTFVDVGQGDASLVELPDGTVILIDAGGLANARDPAVAARPGRTIKRVLAAYGRDHIDLAIISHPHPDHYLGLAGIDVPIRELWFAPEAEEREGSPFRALVAQLEQRGTRIGHPALGAILERAGVTLTALAPRYQPAQDAPFTLAADPVRSVNDNSLVISLRFAGRTILFTGDIEAEGEEQLIAAGLARVDVLKVAHHGSPTSSSEAFIATAHPALAVISCGRGNTFGFPSPAVLARLAAVGAEVARTDREGSIAVVVGADGALTVTRFAGSAL